MKIKQQTGAAFLLTASLIGTFSLGRAEDRPAAEGWAARIDRRVEAWQPIAAERRLDQIGWAKDIRDALRLAKEHHRPIFLFTYSGSSEREHAMALQRC